MIVESPCGKRTERGVPAVKIGFDKNNVTPRVIEVAYYPIAPTSMSIPGNEICEFFKSPLGCLYGAMCRFAHIDNSGPSTATLGEDEGVNPDLMPPSKSSFRNSRNSKASKSSKTQRRDTSETQRRDTSKTSGEKVKKKWNLVKKNTCQNSSPAVTSPEQLVASLEEVTPEQLVACLDNKLSLSQLTTIIKDTAIKETKKPTQRKIRVVQKPQPKLLQDQLDNCTSFEERAHVLQQQQITTLQRRFPQCITTIGSSGNSTILDFDMVPSDPDFPFDLPYGLQVSLSMNRFPSLRDATLNIRNIEIPHHLRTNIQKAFTKKCQNSQLEMLHLINWLDKELEVLLVEKEQSGGIVLGSKNTFLENNNVFNDNQQLEDENNEENEEFEESRQEENEEFEECQDEEIKENEERQLIDTTSLVNKGTSIRLLNISLDNISLIQTLSLSLTVKCSRCKTLADVRGIKPNIDGSTEWTCHQCIKCQETFALNFRPDTLHQMSSSSTLGQLGYVDAVGCTIFDLLPSKFQATCTCGEGQALNACFETYNSSKTCWTCHLVMTFHASQPKFVRIGSTVPTKIGQKIQEQKLEKRKQKREGLSIGTPLPSNGACSHYKRSYRWFRFPCCNKLFPCDVCHEENNLDGHEMVWATRMVCGFCSREQVYSNGKACICGRDLVRTETGGFWNGGLGTRDKAKMNRNETKKYQGIGKTVSRKKMNQ